MTSPSENDDDWAELARELARDRPTPPLPAVEVSSSHSEPVADEGGFAEGVADADENGEFEDAVEPSADTDVETTEESGTGDGQPGTGRKRRRRRRRRRRGGGQTADAGAGASEDASEETKVVETELAEDDFEAASESGYQDELEGDSDPDVLDGEAETDEDAGGELLRELIANWNVPSWDDVVAGLYRPER